MKSSSWTSHPDWQGILAEKGSPEWAQYMRRRLEKEALDEGKLTASIVTDFSAFIEQRGYVHFSNASGKPFRTFEEFATAATPEGLAIGNERLERILALVYATATPSWMAKEATPLDAPKPPPKHVGPGRGKRKPEQENADGNTIPVSPSHQNDTSYLTSRIARDAPDVLERMKAGEFPSVRSAAIAAGIIDPQRQLEQAVTRGIRKLDRDALDRISDIIATRYVELSAKENP